MEKKIEVEALATLLLKKETIVLRDMQEVLGKRPFDMGDEMNEYLSISEEHQAKVDVLREDVYLPDDLNAHLNDFIEMRLNHYKSKNEEFSLVFEELVEFEECTGIVELLNYLKKEK